MGVSPFLCGGTPRKGMLSGLRLRRGLASRRRKSAKSVFQKSELAVCCRSDSGLLKNNADFRRPRISSPPAEAEPDSIPFRGWCFQREKMSFDDRVWVSALRWTTARAEFAPVCRESWGHRRCAGCLEVVGCDAALDAWRNVSCDAALDAWWWGVG